MGTKTSVYLSDELTKRWKESGRSLADLVRDGLDRDTLQETMIRRVFRKELKRIMKKIRGTHNYPADTAPAREVTWEELQEASEE